MVWQVVLKLISWALKWAQVQHCALGKTKIMTIPWVRFYNYFKFWNGRKFKNISNTHLTHFAHINFWCVTPCTPYVIEIMEGEVENGDSEWWFDMEWLEKILLIIEIIALLFIAIICIGSKYTICCIWCCFPYFIVKMVFILCS